MQRRVSPFKHAADAGEGKVVAGLLRVIAQRQVRYGQLHLLGELQQDARGDAVLGADVHMDKGVRLDAVDVAQEQAQHLLGKSAVLLDDEGLQQLVQITEIHREGCDGGDVAVENLQHVYCFQQVFRRLQIQEFAAFLKEQFVIGADITRAIGHNTLVQVAERAFCLGYVIFIGIAQGVIGALTQPGQGQQLLFIGQGRILNDVQCVGHLLVLLSYGGVLAFELCSGPGVLSWIGERLGLIPADVLHAQELEDLKERLSKMTESHGPVVREALLNQYMAIEAAHLMNGKDANAAEAGGGYGQNLTLCDVRAELALAVALETVEGDLARRDVAFQRAAGEVRIGPAGSKRRCWIS